MARYQRLGFVGREVLVPGAFGMNKDHRAVRALVGALGPDGVQLALGPGLHNGRPNARGRIRRAFFQARVAIADKGNALNGGKVFCHEQLQLSRPDEEAGPPPGKRNEQPVAPAGLNW